MSGEVVIAPALPLAVVGIGLYGVGTCAVGVTKVVKSIVDSRVEAAIRKMEREKALVEEWQSYQAEQKKQMLLLQKLHESIAESEKRLSAIKLTQGNVDRTGSGPTAKGYVSENRKRESKHFIQPMIDNIANILRELPTKFIKSENSPYQRLIEQEQNLKRKIKSVKGLSLEEVDSFRKTIHRTLNSYMDSLDRTHKRQGECTKRIESLFKEVLICLNLTSEAKHINELSSIKDNLTNIINSKDFLFGQIEPLEKRFGKTKSEIEFNVTNTAFRSSMAESMISNLTDMGYEPLENFPKESEQTMLQATLRIPGGENLRVAIQPNNKVSFQVCHESGKSDNTVFRQQEKKWCQDLQELIRRLTKEGFSYKINFERFTPEKSIPVVVVETVDDILSNDEGESEIIKEEEDMDRFDDYEQKEREM